MKSWLTLVICMMLVMIIGCAPQQKPAQVDYEKIQAQLEKEQYAYADAWNNLDMDAISQVWAHDDDITIWGPAERARIKGWEGPNGVKAWYQGAFDGMSKVDFKMHDLLIKISKDGTAAVVTYYVENDFVDKEGKPGKMTPRVTVIKEFRDGRWVQIHGDASFSLEEM